MNISTPENVNNLKIRLLIQKVLTLYMYTERKFMDGGDIGMVLHPGTYSFIKNAQSFACEL